MLLSVLISKLYEIVGFHLVPTDTAILAMGVSDSDKRRDVDAP